MGKYHDQLIGKIVSKEGLEKIAGTSNIKDVEIEGKILSVNTIESHDFTIEGWADVLIRTKSGSLIIVEAKSQKEKDIGQGIRQLKKYNEALDADELVLVTGWSIKDTSKKMLEIEGISHYSFYVNVEDNWKTVNE